MIFLIFVRNIAKYVTCFLKLCALLLFSITFPHGGNVKANPFYRILNINQTIKSVLLGSMGFVYILAESLLAVYFISARYGKPVRQKGKKLMSHLHSKQSFIIGRFPITLKSKPVCPDFGCFELRSHDQSHQTLVWTWENSNNK